MVENAAVKSKYIKEKKQGIELEKVGIVFLFSLFVLPQYTGIPTPVFDFTILRMTLILFLFVIFSKPQSVRELFVLIFRSRISLVFLPYLIVLIYTMILRTDINAFLNPFFEMLQFILCIFLFRDILGIEKTLHYLLCFMYILTILGIAEYVIGTSPFSYLKTISGIYTGRFIRSGHYRIMSSCSHSLGYGLLLIATLPISCLDYEKREMSMSRHFPLLVLVCINIFLTGSRSTLVCLFVEIFLLFLVLGKKQMKKFIIALFVIIVLFVLFLIIFFKTSIARYFLLQITTLIDQAFGTMYSVEFGANIQALGSSANYRNQLKYIYQIDWLNPFLGIGRQRSFSSEINGSFVNSIDDFYIAEYVRYAYPGLFSYVFFLVYHVVKMAKGAFRYQSGLCKILMIGMISYMLNLHWVDSLQTLKYMYILVALYYVWEFQELPKLTRERMAVIEDKKRSSRYIRRKRI